MNSNPMPAAEYRAALAEFGLDSKTGALLFAGKTSRTGRRWYNDGAPYAVALVLALMRKYRLTPRAVAKLGEPYRVLAEAAASAEHDRQQVRNRAATLRAQINRIQQQGEL